MSNQLKKKAKNKSIWHKIYTSFRVIGKEKSPIVNAQKICRSYTIV